MRRQSNQVGSISLMTVFVPRRSGLRLQNERKRGTKEVRGDGPVQMMSPLKCMCVE